MSLSFNQTCLYMISTFKLSHNLARYYYIKMKYKPILIKVISIFKIKCFSFNWYFIINNVGLIYTEGEAILLQYWDNSKIIL